MITTQLQLMFKVSPLPVYRHLLTRRTVFSKTVFSIARSTFRMYSVMAEFNLSIVCTVIVRCTQTFWSPCILNNVIDSVSVSYSCYITRHAASICCEYSGCMEARGCAVGRGAGLQTWRLLVWFLTMPLEFFIDIILPAALWPHSWRLWWCRGSVLASDTQVYLYPTGNIPGTHLC
jgi:hypothetical protein